MVNQLYRKQKGKIMYEPQEVRVIDLVEQQIRNWIQTQGFSVREVFVGIHNAFAHGDIFKYTDVTLTDNNLKELYVHFDGLIKVAKKVENQ